MRFHLFYIFTFLYVPLEASHDAQPTEVYWNKVFPNTVIPIVIKDLLIPAWMKGGAQVKFESGGWQGYYKYGNTRDQLQAHPKTTIFFFEQDMHVGNKMNLHFHKTAKESTFLPRHIAKSIPFSSKKLSEILKYFYIKPKSREAKLMNHTIKLCEDPVVSGEPEICSTSLESMIDFTFSQLGKHVRTLSTEVENETRNQTYTINGVEKMVIEKMVVCHKLPYIYAVFYCHSPQKTEAYSVPLVGADGSMVNAVAICHKDTSLWYPKHLAFRLLKVKPGTVPICHFVLQDHIVWLVT